MGSRLQKITGGLVLLCLLLTPSGFRLAVGDSDDDDCDSGDDSGDYVMVPSGDDSGPGGQLPARTSGTFTISSCQDSAEFTAWDCDDDQCKQKCADMEMPTSGNEACWDEYWCCCSPAFVRIG